VRGRLSGQFCSRCARRAEQNLFEKGAHAGAIDGTPVAGGKCRRVERLMAARNSPLEQGRGEVWRAGPMPAARASLGRVASLRRWADRKGLVPSRRSPRQVRSCSAAGRRARAIARRRLCTRQAKSTRRPRLASAKKASERRMVSTPQAMSRLRSRKPAASAAMSAAVAEFSPRNVSQSRQANRSDVAGCSSSILTRSLPDQFPRRPRIVFSPVSCSWGSREKFLSLIVHPVKARAACFTSVSEKWPMPQGE